MSGPKEHWEAVYRTKQPTEVSWYQRDPEVSLRLIETLIPDRASAVIDVGGGASVLGARLLESGYTDVTVLELSGAALEVARAAMGTAANRLHWVEADILDVELPHGRFHLWHDRAVFHFLIDPEDRADYLRQLRGALAPGGVVVLATFAEDGPARCSGLDVRRYSVAALEAEFGPDFTLVQSEREEHRTPGGGTQLFTYGVFRRTALASTEETGRP